MLHTIYRKIGLRNNYWLDVKILRYSVTYFEKESSGYNEFNEFKNKSNIKVSIYSVLLGSFLCFQLKKLSNKFELQKANCATKLFTKEEISKHKTKETGIWVTYKNVVYDITDFIGKHPGGDKIKLAAGGAVEPYWSLYAVHINNKEVMNILEELKIGEVLHKPDEKLEECIDDPYRTDPERHPALKIVNMKPFNAETPKELLTEHFLTPNSLFFVRNHLPVPVVDIEKYQLSINGIGMKYRNINLKIDEVKKLATINSIESTIMCSGNRRKDMFNFKSVKGLGWEHGAISTAKWTGIKLVDFFAVYDLNCKNLTEMGAKHIQFEGLDSDPVGARYGASIPIDMALDPQSDVLLAWKMNDEDIPLDHGFPLRVIIPGVVGARQVKWLTKIVISDKESDSFWQQNDYKTFSPNIDFDKIDYSSMPPIMESNVQSAICEPCDGQAIRNDGFVVVKGYAWSGGGRGIIRVELSTDGGTTWIPAIITQSKDVPTSSYINRKQWTWALWELELPVDGNCEKMEILCKAVDSSQNCQPETYKGTWNVRGLLANAWHRINITFYND